MAFETIIAVLGAALLLSLSLIGYAALGPSVSRRARVKRRISAVSGGGEGMTGRMATGKDSSAGRRREIQAKLKELEKRSAEKKPLSIRLRDMLRAAGLGLSVQRFFLICGVVALIAMGIYVALDYPWYGAPLVGIAVGFGLPRYYVSWLSKRRVKKFTQQFADAVDIIVRGIKSGLPIGECLSIIARESPEPVAGVFQEIVEGQRIGLGMEGALSRAGESMPTNELKFFSIVLLIQQQTGGNLADTLSNLSGILRARKKMEDKVKAMSSEARASSMIIGSLPFLMGLLLFFVSPEYIGLLFEKEYGHIMLIGGLVWMGIGIIIMKQMVNFEI